MLSAVVIQNGSNGFHRRDEAPGNFAIGFFKRNRMGFLGVQFAGQTRPILAQPLYLILQTTHRLIRTHTLFHGSFKAAQSSIQT